LDGEEFDDGIWCGDGSLDVTVTDTGVLFAVTEDQAVDSYNQEFTCSAKVPLARLPELISVLTAALQNADHEK
jgi:hypothetical protein